MTMSLVNWNVRWATPRSVRTPEILRRAGLHSPDVICLTESDKELLSPDGYVIYTQADYGHRLIRNRRKVMLWSREPWDRVDDLGHEGMPELISEVVEIEKAQVRERAYPPGITNRR